MRNPQTRNPPLASVLNFICGRIIHHNRIRAFSYCRASLHLPPDSALYIKIIIKSCYEFPVVMNRVNRTVSICPAWVQEYQSLFLRLIYYREAPGLFGLICPELRADWLSRCDAEDAAWSLSNRPRCWSSQWRTVCLGGCLIVSDRSYRCCLMFVMKVRRQRCCVQLKQAFNWELQLLMVTMVLESGTVLRLSAVRAGEVKSGERYCL